jgi:glycosyltransferase involved in cell wall biosynthesis
VALPYYREGIDYLCRAVNSLRAQDFTDWRAVIVDDSPDGFPEIAEIMGYSGDKRISYGRNAGPHGIGPAWNSCLDLADTELVCLLHTDDEYETDYLSSMVTLARAFPDASAYFSGATVIDWRSHATFSLPDRVKEFITPRGEPVILRGPSAISSLMIGNYIMCPTIVYRRSKIAGRRFSTTHRFVLDFRFTLGVLMDGGTIVGTHRKSYRYRRHAEQATAKMTSVGDRFNEELELFREFASMGKPWSNAAKTRPTFRLSAALSRKWDYVF